MDQVKIARQGNFFPPGEHHDPDWASELPRAGSSVRFYSNTDGDCIFPIGRVLTSQSLRLAGFKRLSVEEMKESDELLQTAAFQDHRELFV